MWVYNWVSHITGGVYTEGVGENGAEEDILP
jgi:hypothetical protein